MVYMCWVYEYVPCFIGNILLQPIMFVGRALPGIQLEMEGGDKLSYETCSKKITITTMCFDLDID